MNDTRKATRLSKLRAKLNNHATIVIQLLVFAMFIGLILQSIRSISILDGNVTKLNVRVTELSGHANQEREFSIAEYQSLYIRTRDLQHETQDLQSTLEVTRNTLHNKTSLAFPHIIKQAMPSVVGVTNSSNPIGKINGSGFVIDAANGYIMTAKHVVARDVSMRLMPDGMPVKYEIELTCGDRITVRRIYKYLKDDLAILVVDTNDPNYCLVSELQIADLTDPANALRRGDIVLGLGNPFSILFSASAGIISNPNAKHIRYPEENQADRIQLDMMLNPGNSGCAILNTQGSVIGVWVTGRWVVRQSAGVSFAVPIKTINDCLVRFNEWIVTNDRRAPQHHSTTAPQHHSSSCTTPTR